MSKYYSGSFSNILPLLSSLFIISILLQSISCNNLDSDKDCESLLSLRTKRDFSSLCPNHVQISPCICNADYNTLSCNNIDSDERLKEIFEANFTHNRITKIEIRNSPITTLSTNLFQKIRMHDIEIRDNNLTTVEPNAFAGSERTALYINLNNNQIHKFDFGCITNVKTLRQLQLSYNRLTEIPDNAFGRLNKLDFVALNNNQIRRIGKNAFEHLSSLTFLDLGHNELLQLGPFSMTFHGIDSVDNRLSLVLNQNSIGRVDPKAFQGSRPTVLALVRNNLTTLEPEVFKPILQSMSKSNSMVGLSVRGNPIECDCRIKWLLEEPKLIESLGHFECSDGTTFFNVTADILTCSQTDG